MIYESVNLSSPLCSRAEWEKVNAVRSRYVFIHFSEEVEWVYLGKERMVQVMEYTNAGIVYSDRLKRNGQEVIESPVCDYQSGAVRDDFDFGSVVLLSTEAVHTFLQMGEEATYRYGTWYAFRLWISEQMSVVHIPEYLYYEIEKDSRASGEKIFDYVNPKNEKVQKEMEIVFTEYLRRNGYYIGMGDLKTVSEESSCSFPVTASVVIPCRNRVKTISEAICSAVQQRVASGHTMNVIVVDDNSTDGTVELISELVKENKKQRETNKTIPELVYIRQNKTYHAIGGNWNVAVHSDFCGRYAIQLDSDDTYADDGVVEKFIQQFESGRYAMVIGTYRLTDLSGKEIPPGVISHREWTDSNGHNNALRINGLGAPRGFDTSVLRTIDFPTVLYGEDYAVALRIAREYKIGRIWDVVYHCRRWENNSDANCDIVTMNKHNMYKDRLRTWELQARKK